MRILWFSKRVQPVWADARYCLRASECFQQSSRVGMSQQIAKFEKKPCCLFWVSRELVQNIYSIDTHTFAEQIEVSRVDPDMDKLCHGTSCFGCIGVPRRIHRNSHTSLDLWCPNICSLKMEIKKANEPWIWWGMQNNESYSQVERNSTE